MEKVIYCPKCETMNRDTRTRCFNCGEPLLPSTTVEPSKDESPQEDVTRQNPNNAVPPKEHKRASPASILSRSVSAKPEMERWKKDNLKTASRLPMVGAIPLLVFALFWAYAANSDNWDLRKMSETLSESVLLWIILFGIVGVFSFMSTKLSREVDEMTASYLIACDTEYLVLDEEKIYGSTKHGSITLYYHQIHNVRCIGSSMTIFNQNTNDFSYNRLVITDLSDNRFEFVSFANARELCTLIESIVSTGRDS